jgi:hypothetical protein
MSLAKLYIVLVKSPTVLSRTIAFLKGDQYTHAALAFDRELDLMFSFGRRHPYNPFWGGFMHESLDRGLYGLFETLSGLIMEIPVTAAQYRQACALVGVFVSQREQYGFNTLGLLSHATSWRFRQEYNFYCAEFVYHVLHECGIGELGLARECVRPIDFLRLDGKIVYAGDLKQLPKQL